MKMYDRVAGPKKSGRNNEMTRPDYRGGRKVGFHCTMVLYIILLSYTTVHVWDAIIVLSSFQRFHKEVIKQFKYATRGRIFFRKRRTKNPFSENIRNG